MSTTELHDISLISHIDNDAEFDHKLLKKMRQLEGEHKIQKAVLEQKIELLEVKVKEFEEREAALKKMNSEILLTLNDLNKKEDSAIMNKVFEELAIANKEKLRDKKQQQTKLINLKSQLELNIQDLKERLAKSEREKKEMKMEHDNRVLELENELEHERKVHESVKRELEEKRNDTRGDEETQKLKKRVAMLEEENNSLKKEYEKEANKMKGRFERSLAELKEIHEEERSNFESRLKKTKELLAKAEGESEARTAIESQLSQEIALLREKLTEIESSNALEIERINTEKEDALTKVIELEKSLGEAKAAYEKAEKTTCDISADLFAQNLEERLKALEDKEQKESAPSKTANTKPGSRNTLCEQASVDQFHAFNNFESQMPSLANSMIHDPFMMEQKKNVAPSHSQMLVPDLSSYWITNDEHSHNNIRMAYSKPNSRRNSGHGLNYLSQPQTPKYYYNEQDNRRSMVKSICTYSEKPENVLAQRVYPNEPPHFASDNTKSHFAPNSSMTAMEPVSIKEWSLKDTSQMRSNWGEQGNIRHPSGVNEEDYGLYASEVAEFGVQQAKEGWTYDDVVKKIKERNQQSGVRVQMNYPERTRAKNEGLLLRRNGSHGVVELLGRRDVSSEKLDVWRDCSVSVLKEDESHYEGQGQDMYKRGLQDVMLGLKNIKTRLEKQQEDIIIAKNESINELNKRRSLSNARVRPSVVARDTVNTSSFYVPYGRSRGSTGINQTNVTEANRSLHMTDENMSNIHHNVSCHGEREAQVRYVPVESTQTSYRTRTPVMVRGSGVTQFQGRHRGGMVCEKDG